MGPKPFKADPYASGGATQTPFREGNVPTTRLAFLGQLMRLARVRGFGYAAKRPNATPVSVSKNPVNIGSHGITKF